jgi:phosphatidylserine/phosphatidylglycerophosphate/cardiolipin synthase-like enzyme
MSRRLSARPAALPRDFSPLRTLADQAFSRAAGAPLVGGNRVRVLQDATENYPAWARAIIDARESIHVEMYIVHRDDVGRRFVELLAARARDGIRIRFLYDWFGCGIGPLVGLFKPLIQAGGEVLAFNPPTFTSILGWTRRDHRKLLTIDGRVAFVSGLCIGQMWEGRKDRGQAPWRDTGIEIVGPAVAHAEQAFAAMWNLAGGEIAINQLPKAEAIAPAGSVALRLIPTEPFTARILQLDLLVAAMARRSLWITDAYFLGHGPYMEALKRAAQEGVDVRLLLPQGSDVGWTVPVSRTLYRTLLESGVRIFEWNGTMIHAKTAVADSRWARIGSTNLNLNSWLGNWELDVAIEDEGVAKTLESHFEEDLERSTEIVLTARPRPVAATIPPPGSRPAAAARRHRSSRRVVRAVTGVSRSIGAAVTGSRPLENFELMPVLSVGLILAALAVVGLVAPRALAWPLAGLAAWMGVTFLVEAWSLWHRGGPK